MADVLETDLAQLGLLDPLPVEPGDAVGPHGLAVLTDEGPDTVQGPERLGGPGARRVERVTLTKKRFIGKAVSQRTTQTTTQTTTSLSESAFCLKVTGSNHDVRMVSTLPALSARK